MQILFFTLSLLVAWSAMSYYSWQELRLSQWWDRLYHERRFDSLQMNAQLQSQHYRYFNHPRSPSVAKSTSAASHKAVQSEADPQITRRDDIPLRLCAKRSFPETMRFPVEKSVILQENPEGKRWQEAWGRLLENLYGAFPFYQASIQADPNTPLKLLKTVLEKIEKKNAAISSDASANTLPRSSFDLAALELEDPVLNHLWTQMLSQKHDSSHTFPVPSIFRFIWFKDWIAAPEISAVNIHYCEYPVLEAVLGKKVAIEIWKQRLGLLEHALANDASFQADRIDCYYMQDHVLQNLIRLNEADLPFPYAELRKYISFKTTLDRREAVETVVLTSRYAGKAQSFELIAPAYQRRREK